MTKAKEFKDQPVEELEAKLIDLRRELFHLVNEQKQAKKTEKPHLIRLTRRNIARLLTVMREKKAVVK